jgi:hypothetical protein
MTFVRTGMQELRMSWEGESDRSACLWHRAHIFPCLVSLVSKAQQFGFYAELGSKYQPELLFQTSCTACRGQLTFAYPCHSISSGHPNVYNLRPTGDVGRRQRREVTSEGLREMKSLFT